MSAQDNKLKHLEFVQLTLIRMAANSFLIKAWTVTLIAALFAISVNATKTYLLIGYIPLVSFWALDAYYLRQERLFRRLYDLVREKDEKDIDFSLDTSKVRGVASWFQVFRSTTLELFYGPILVLLLLATGFIIIDRWG